MSVTLDANVLLFASDGSSTRQPVARRLLDSIAAGPELAYLFWPTIMAYLRIATHPAVFNQPLPARDAIANVEAMLSRPHVRAPGEEPEFWRRYRSVAEDARPTGNLVSDAHLVALVVEPQQVERLPVVAHLMRRVVGVEETLHLKVGRRFAQISDW